MIWTNNGDYDSWEWFYLRLRVLERFSWRCVMCGKLANVAHHLTYRYGVLCPVKYLIAVCGKCHDEIYHGRRSKIYE